MPDSNLEASVKKAWESVSSFSKSASKINWGKRAPLIQSETQSEEVKLTSGTKKKFLTKS